MSKIGNNPVVIDNDINVVLNDTTAVIKGPEGEFTLELSRVIKTEIKENKAYFTNIKDDKKSRAMHGLIRMLFANAVAGVKKPWEKVLEIHGVGFRAKIESESLIFQIGYSHPVIFKIPTDVKINLKGNKIMIIGVDKQRVGEVAAAIKRIRKPDKYKGKGIRYQGEVIKLKPGKKAKTAAA